VAPLQVLIIDDEPGLLELLTVTLQDAGHVVQGALDAAAVEPALARRYDVIVTDYGLPGLPAPTLLARLASAAPGTPVILITGDEVGPIAASPRLARVFLKPFPLSELLTAVERVVRGG
jgi:two-component system OmpR family response regulator